MYEHFISLIAYIYYRTVVNCQEYLFKDFWLLYENA